MQEKIIAQARTWLGTPFHHQARTKGAGCDCLGLFIGVSKELDLKSHLPDGNGGFIPLAAFDNIEYSKEPDTDKLISKLGMCLDSIEKQEMQIGDIVLIKLANSPRHLGIVTNYIHGGFGLLHSLYGNGVVEHGLDETWSKSIYKVYRLK